MAGRLCIYNMLMPDAVWELVPGWFSIYEYQDIKPIVEDRRVLEIGTYCGRSTIAIATLAKHVTSVDHFLGDDWPRNTNNGVGSVDPNGVLARYKNLKLLASKITQMVGDFKVILKHLDLDSFDAFFYDANHLYEPTMHALRAFEKTRKPIAVHDYYDMFPGAIQAINDFIADSDYVGNRTEPLRQKDLDDGTSVHNSLIILTVQ